MGFIQLIEEIKSLKDKNISSKPEGVYTDKDLIPSLGSIFDEILIKLNLLILSGKYLDVKNIEEAKDRLSLLKKELIESSDSGNIEVNSKATYFEYIYTTIIPTFDEILNRIIALSDFANTRYNPSTKKVVLEAISNQKDLKNYNLPVFVFTQWRNALTFNILTAKTDHALEKDQKQLNELIIIYESIKREGKGYPLVIEIALTEKIIFLIRKLLLQYNKEENLVYQLDNKEYNIADIKNTKSEFNDLLEKSNYHYSEYRDKKKIWENRIQPLYTQRDKNNKDLSYYHVLTQHYRLDHKSVSRIDNLFEDFKIIFSEKVADYSTLSYHEKRAWLIANGYIKNSRFSLMVIDSSNFSLNEIEEYFKEILINQKEFNTINYYPYLKFCCYLNKEIEKLTNKERPDFDYVDRLVNTFNCYFEQLEQKLDWCKRINLQKYLLEDSFCKISLNIDNRDVIVFIASSYVLPIDYKNKYKELKRLKNQSSLFQNQLNLYKYIASEKKSVDMVALKVKDNEKNQVQILSVFAAIVIFAAGTISSVSHNTAKSVKDTVQNSIGFGYSLGLFVILIWVITRPSAEKISAYHKAIALIFFLSNLCLALWAFEFLNLFQK